MKIKNGHFEYGQFMAVGFHLNYINNLGYLYFNQDYVYTDLAYIRLTPMIAHTLFGIIMGILFAKSAFQLIKNNLGIYLSLFIPILLHGLYNFSHDSYQIPSLVDFVFWVGIIVILFLLVFDK